jgi:fatty-acyl-CoA synthase
MITTTHELALVQGADRPALLRTGMHDVLHNAARKFPESTAVASLWQDTSLTFSQLDQYATDVAASLLSCGVRAGDRVGIWSGNRWEWIAVQFAVARTGAILVNINPAYRSTELEYVLRHSGCKVLFMARAFRDFDFTVVAQQVRGAVPALEHLVVFADACAADMLSWPSFLARADAALRQAAEATVVDVAAAANIQYTSGTTGAPKGAVLSHLNLVNNAYLIGARLGLTADDRICLPVPMFHCFGMAVGVLGSYCFGAAVILPGEAFDAGSCLDAIERERCTCFYGVPMMFIALLNHPDFDKHALTSLRTGLMGGAPCPVEILKAAIERMHMHGVSVVYGMTETSPISFQSLPTDGLAQRVETVGTVQAHTEAKVVEPSTGETLAVGQPGELCVRGYLVMLGYWDNPQATAKAIDADGWMHTGDLAQLREDGRMEIVGRIKDMVIRGGENIFPREVEEFLFTLDGIEDAQVFGIPCELYGEELCAWIRLKQGVALTPEAIRALCKGRIASFKIPTVIRMVQTYPMTASGKVQKFRMREAEVGAQREGLKAHAA